MPIDDYSEEIASRDLKYYIFDWDDNILRMPTCIHMDKKGEDGSWTLHKVSTALFSVIRKDTENWRPPDGDWNKAFVEFRDSFEEPESKFLTDAREAIDRLQDGTVHPAPSFETFKKALREGRIFAIVTARGHQPESLRKGVEMFIQRCLTDEERAEMIRNLRGYIVVFDGTDANSRMTDADVLDRYLSLNRYHAVANPDFINAVRASQMPDPENSETRKRFAILDFLEHLFHMVERVGDRRSISVGFSDDDSGNVESVARFIRETLATRFPAVKFVVYDTSDPELERGHKLVVSGQMGLFGDEKPLP